MEAEIETASPELNDELYNLSKWFDRVDGYTAGFLLRKLPKGIQEDESYYLARFFLEPSTDYWSAGYRKGAAKPEICVTDKKPENALCALAIELHKQGILKKGIGDE